MRGWETAVGEEFKKQIFVTNRKDVAEEAQLALSGDLPTELVLKDLPGFLEGDLRPEGCGRGAGHGERG